MDCMVAMERTAGARTECLAQIFGRHVPDCREVRRCVGPEQVQANRLRAQDTPSSARMHDIRNNLDRNHRTHVGISLVSI